MLKNANKRSKNAVAAFYNLVRFYEKQIPRYTGNDIRTKRKYNSEATKIKKELKIMHENIENFSETITESQVNNAKRIYIEFFALKSLEQQKAAIGSIVRRFYNALMPD